MVYFEFYGVHDETQNQMLRINTSVEYKMAVVYDLQCGQF